MKLKFLAALLATGLAATSAHATTYSVLGTQGYSIDGITDPEGLGGMLTQNPNPPVFSGSWSIDIDAPSLAGGFVFAPYTTNVTIPAVSATIDLNASGRVLAVSGGSYSYDAAARTLDITHALFLETGSSPTCSDNGGGLYCAFIPTATSHGALTLTFAPDLLSFTGVANLFQEINDGSIFIPDPASSCIAEGGVNACVNETLTFSGTAVPVPAAAWLFGSAVVGLGALKRRKAA